MLHRILENVNSFISSQSPCTRSTDTLELYIDQAILQVFQPFVEQVAQQTNGWGYAGVERTDTAFDARR